MGPRSSDRGNPTWLPLTTFAYCPPSMGPRSSDRGNLSLPHPSKMTHPALQWGRDLPTAEMRSLTGVQSRSPAFNGAAIFRPRKSGKVGHQGLAYHPPSMGPRSSDRGNSGLLMRPGGNRLGNLQWGRDLPTAEISPMAEIVFLDEICLQWGRDLPTAEIKLLN